MLCARRAQVPATEAQFVRQHSEDDLVKARIFAAVALLLLAAQARSQQPRLTPPRWVDYWTTPDSDMARALQAAVPEIDSRLALYYARGALRGHRVLFVENIYAAGTWAGDAAFFVLQDQPGHALALRWAAPAHHWKAWPEARERDLDLRACLLRMGDSAVVFELLQPVTAQGRLYLANPEPQAAFGHEVFVPGVYVFNKDLVAHFVGPAAPDQARRCRKDGAAP